MNNNNIVDIQLTKKQGVDVKLVLSALLLTFMVYFRDLGVIPFAPFHFIILLTFISLLLPFDSLRAFFFFQIPFECGGYHGIGSIPLLIALIIKSPKHNTFQYIFPVFLVFFEFCHIVSYPFSTDINQLVLYAISLLFFFFILFDDSADNFSVKKCTKCYVIGCTIVLLLIIIHSVSSFGVAEVFMGAYRIGGDGGAFLENELDGVMRVVMNANTLAYFSVTALALLLFTKDLFTSRIAKWPFLIVLGLAGILSTSRTWLLIVTLMFLLYFLLGNYKNRFGFIFATIIVFLIISRYGSFTDNMVNRFEDRLGQENVSTAGNRTGLFKEYNSFMLKNPERIIYGTGALYYKNICHVWNSIHNGVQQVFVCYGIIGILFFLICINNYYRRYIKKKKIKLWYYVPIIVCFLFDQSIQFLNPYVLMLPFLVCALPLKNKYETLC